MLKYFSVLLLFLSTQAHALPEPKNMRFSYVPAEGKSVPCRHERIRDLPDWRVTCASGRWQRTYKAHVILRQFSHADGGSGLEILYWVIEPSGKEPQVPPKYHSTAASLRLEGKTSLSGISLWQGLEKEVADLVLRADGVEE